MPSMLVPNHDHAVTIVPAMAQAIRPRSPIIPPQRAWRMMAFHKTRMSAPFSFGSQPQNRPHAWSPQIPPVTVPVNEKSSAKQTTP